jgi:flagellar hook-associated protein 1 FlgK
MGDFLSTGLSGLFAFKRAIDVTSHNIANVGTEGYSRQRAEFVTREATRIGNGYVGNGVSVATTTRSYDDLLAQNVRLASSSYSNLSTYTSYLEKLSNLFGDTNTGITASMSKFSAALQDVSNNPSSISARQVLLAQASALTERLKNYDAQMGNLDASVEATLQDGVSDINSLSKNLAKLNEQIAGAYAQGAGNPPNDLLDQRERLLNELSSKVDVTTVQQQDGSISVFIGSGQSLVVGSTYSQFALTTDQYDPNRHGVSLVTTGGTKVDITSSIKGGSLGGALDFRNQVLDPARNTLGHIAVGLADVINKQHHAGLDLTGNLGGDLFNIGPVETRPRVTNTGTGQVAVTRSDGTAITEGDYFLTKTATGWSMRREDTGATVTLTGSGTVADPFKGDGLSIVVSGAANTNDSFLIRPTRQAVNGLSVAITDPAKIAAAAPIKTLAASSNTGSGKISAGSVVDATDPNLRNTATIAFTSATTYTINGAGSFTYTPGSDITVNGVKFSITGTPATGDQFTVQDNVGGVGDNRNTQALYDALNSKSLDNRTTSLNDTTNRLISNIGVLTQQAQQNRDAQQVVQDQAKSELDSISGVNLDEEAANLIRYQQAYQAAAQLIGVANTLFDTLLNATRG